MILSSLHHLRLMIKKSTKPKKSFPGQQIKSGWEKVSDCFLKYDKKMWKTLIFIGS